MSTDVSRQQLLEDLRVEVKRSFANHLAVQVGYALFLLVLLSSMAIMYAPCDNDGMPSMVEYLYCDKDGRSSMLTSQKKGLMADKAFKGISTRDAFYDWLRLIAQNFWSSQEERNKATNDEAQKHLGVDWVKTRSGPLAEQRHFPLHFMTVWQEREKRSSCSSGAEQAAALHPELWNHILTSCVNINNKTKLLWLDRDRARRDNETGASPFTQVTGDPFVANTSANKVYSVTLPYDELNLENVTEIVSHLQKNNWTDIETRKVSVETLVFNAMRNEYVVLRYEVVFEWAGRVTPRSTADVFWLLNFDISALCLFHFTCDLFSYFLLFVYEIGQKLLFLRVLGWNKVLFYELWGIVHLGQGALLGMYLWHRYYLWCKSEELFSYGSLFAATKNISAALLLLTLLRGYEFVCYTKPLASRVTDTVCRAARDLPVIVALGSVVTLGFALLATVIYGSHSDDFNSYGASIGWLLRTAFSNKFRTYNEMQDLEPIWTPVFFLIYFPLVWGFLMHVALGVLSAASEEASSLAGSPASCPHRDAYRVLLTECTKSEGRRKYVHAIEVLKSICSETDAITLEQIKSAEVSVRSDKKQTAKVFPLPQFSLSETKSWQVLGHDLTKLAKEHPILRWGFYLCAGHKQALVRLKQYERLYNAHSSEPGDTLANKVANTILLAFREPGDRHTYLNSLSISIYTMLACPTSLAQHALQDLLMEGVLQQREDGTKHLQPALVRQWASGKSTDLMKLVHEYLSVDVFRDPNVFVRQTYLFEQILNCAYAELKQNPTLEEYFDGADFCGELSRYASYKVHPRKVPQLSVFKTSQKDESEVKKSLSGGATVYFQDSSGMDVDVLIPLQLAETDKHEPTTHIFCGQNKVEKLNKNSVEEKVTKMIAELRLENAHGLVFTVHRHNLKNRSGVWLRENSLKKWFGRLAMPQWTASPSAPVSSPLPTQKPSSKKSSISPGKRRRPSS